MGATSFTAYGEGSDVSTAFANARDNALMESGHGRYTGTITNKHEFTVITHTPMTMEDAETLARQLINDADQRINDKWGPAGAIPIMGDTRTIKVDIPSTPGGWATPLDAALAALTLADGERINGTPTGIYQMNGQGRVLKGTATVQIVGGETHTGWLFFGNAPT